MSRVARVPSSDRRQQILRAANLLFARQGYKGTTTRQIAAAADVNEAIVFRHFRSKHDLYWATIEEKIRSRGDVDWLRNRVQQGGDLAAMLIDIAEHILHKRAQNPDLTRLLLFSVLENHRLSEQFFRTYVAEHYETLASFIRDQVRLGALRKDIDPLLAARSFFGMLIYHSQIQDLFGASRVQPFEARHVAETVTAIWMNGVRPPTVDPPKPGRKKRS